MDRMIHEADLDSILPKLVNSLDQVLGSDHPFNLEFDGDVFLRRQGRRRTRRRFVGESEPGEDAGIADGSTIIL